MGLTTADGSNLLTQQTAINLGPVARGTINMSVDDSRTYQTMFGLGAAFTDSSTCLMNNLKSNNPGGYNTLMNSSSRTDRSIRTARFVA